MLVKDLIDTIFSHNEIIAIWENREDDGNCFHYLLWRGMAWDLKEKQPNLYNSRFQRIFGTIPQSITQADTINILID